MANIKLNAHKWITLCLICAFLFTEIKAIIAANGPVTQSSTYGFPYSNIVDNNFSNFAHTSCFDVGWMNV